LSQGPSPAIVNGVTAVISVGGLTPFTTVDYPDALAAVVFCQGCPWRCRYCHNPGLLGSDATAGLSWDDVVGYLERRRGLLDGVVFSGGEPTVQRHLRRALLQVKELGFLVGLHTAGCYPQRLRAVLPLVDWVGFDIKATRPLYPEVTGVPRSGEAAWRSLELVLGSGVPYEVRTTVHPALTDLRRLDLLVADLWEVGVQNFALQRCRTGNVLDPTLDSSPSPGYLWPQLYSRYRGSFEGFVVRH